MRISVVRVFKSATPEDNCVEATSFYHFSNVGRQHEAISPRAPVCIAFITAAASASSRFASTSSGAAKCGSAAVVPGRPANQSHRHSGTGVVPCFTKLRWN